MIDSDHSELFEKLMIEITKTNGMICPNDMIDRSNHIYSNISIVSYSHIPLLFLKPLLYWHLVLHGCSKAPTVCHD